MDEVSENSEELIDDDDGEDDFEVETDNLENEIHQMPEVKNNDLENAIQKVLGIDQNDETNDTDQLLEFESNDHDINSEQINVILDNNNVNAIDTDTDDSHQRSYLPPAVGIEFESYDDAYNYYNSYAKYLGFGIRVKSSWTKRNSKEKRGAVLCCNCEGFKTMKETGTRRKETRTGCLAMIRLRLLESNRWRLDEVKLEHNHLFNQEQAQNSRSHKKFESGTKRKSDSSFEIEVQTIKLYRTPAIESYGSSNEGEIGNLEQSKRLKINKGCVKSLYDYFRQAQLMDPNFFYIIDFSDEGYLRNVFWMCSRSRVACGYFGDVVLVDTTWLSEKHDIPLVTLTGINHHRRSVLLGCAFLADESIESYVWLMRTWITCISGRPPQTIITDQCKALGGAIAEVLPRAEHRFFPPFIIRGILEKVGELGGEFEIFRELLNQTVYNSSKVEDFETGWEEMMRSSAIRHCDLIQSLYNDRERWVPVFLKNTFSAGIYSSQTGEYTSPSFHGYLPGEITWDNFFDTYDSIQQENIQKEALDDLESRDFKPAFQTRINYESQLSEVYTKETFLKFQEELVLMSSCLSVTQITGNGALNTYLVKERDSDLDSRNFEVIYDKVLIEVRCICSCINFNGYLCRHALSVLHYNGVEKIPDQYILTRWRKDLQRVYFPDLGSTRIDITNPVQRFDHLYRRAMQVVGEGVVSRDRQMVALGEFRKALKMVRLESGKNA